MDKLDLENMLPHRSPMLMISEVLSYDEHQLMALSQIDVENPLLEHGIFPGYATLELLAQASGLFLGLNMNGEGKPGAIVSVRHMVVYKTALTIDEVMKIETHFLGGSGRAAMFRGLVRQAGEQVMEATLTVSSFGE